jgi:N-acetylmuramoyl-L-alanine amidase
MIGMTLMQEEYLDSISLASKIENAFEGLNKRIRRRRETSLLWYYIKHMPRVLVEMGFISNYVEEIYWTQSQVRMKLPLRLLMQ